MRLLLTAFLVFLSLSAFTQTKSKYLYAHISDRSVTLTPFYKPLGSNFDPALTVGLEFPYRVKGPSSLFQTVEITGFSHALTGTGLSLASSIGYRHQLSMGLFGEASVGITGSGFVSGRETFSLNENGLYEKVTPLHWTLGVPVDLRLGYAFGDYAVYATYRYQVEGRYTDILPMLPSSLLGFGIKKMIQ